MIRLEKFGGIAPKLGNLELPDNGARIANDIDITGGSLRKFQSLTSPRNTVVSSDGTIFGALDKDDIASPGNAPPVSVAYLRYLCRPQVSAGNWLSIHYRVWGIFTPFGGNTQQMLSAAVGEIQNLEYRMTEQGMRIKGRMVPLNTLNQIFTVNEPGVVKIKGPTYQFLFTGNQPYGGPSVSLAVPETPYFGDQELPITKVPLSFDGPGIVSQLYGAFEVVDVSGPKWDEEYSIEVAPEQLAFPYVGYYPTVDFNVNLNYAEPRRRTFYYVQSKCRDDGLVEGPPSDVSEAVLLYPGTFVGLATETGDMKLYRSATGGDDFMLLDEGGSAPDEGGANFQDWGRPVTNIPVPHYGNYPSTSSESGSVPNTLFHPGSFGVTWKNNILYLSDRYRLHAWPGDFTVPFPSNIVAAVITGSTILVFAGDLTVYAVNGNNPNHMSRSLLTDDKGLSTLALKPQLSICRMGSNIFWVSNDGLAVSNGGTPELISLDHFTPFQWGAMTSQECRTFVLNNSIILNASAVTRFQIDEDKVKSVTTLTSAGWASGSPISSGTTLIGVNASSGGV